MNKQLHYVWITSKELIVTTWEYIRKHRLHRLSDNDFPHTK